MKIEAKLKYAKISPKKVRDVSHLLPGKLATEAVALMKCIPRKSARMLGALLNSAMANAENGKNLAASGLVVDSVIVEEGPVLKRFVSAAKGSAHPIKKRMSHVRLTLKEIERKVG
ncbi:MAG: 50S ribosomal protein L22 [Puniceicoccales bacterium]|jgi:large subunit ribosomal protein L22|nr:50S ribosomal protein L22 [Puniceicoccales bacterium]